MRVVTNTASLFLQRQLSQNSTAVAGSLHKLSSGLRINTAADDAAGLQLSNRITSQINGQTVAMRNANDAISMAQVAEGAMKEVTNAIHRIRDLSIQAANGVYSDEDRVAMQQEVTQLQKEIDRINDTTSFGSKRLFGPTNGRLIDVVERDIVKGMAKSWLYESEQIIMEEFGIDGNNRTLKIDLEHLDGAGGTAARVQFIAPNFAQNLVMQIDLDDFNASNLPNGDPGGLQLDEVVLHEVVHAMQGASFSEWANLSAWFKEGSAEYIRGADDRVETDIANSAGANRAAQIATLWTATQAEAGSTAVVSAAGAYSGGYIVMRYLRDSMGKEGMIDLNQELAGGATFDAALSAASGGRWANEAAIFTDLNGAADDPTYATKFEEFIETKMNFIDGDNGAAGGFGVEGSQAPRRENTMQGLGLGDKGALSFVESFVSGDDDTDQTDFDATTANYDTSGNPDIDEVFLHEYQTRVNSGGGQNINAQVGAAAFQTIDFSLGAISSENLGIDYIDVIDNPQFAVIAADDALRIIDGSRAQLGAVMNRLGYTVNNLANIRENASASRSRIRDTDFAIETVELTKNQIKQQAATSLLSQANQMSELALSLLA